MSDPAGLASSDEEGLPNGGDGARGRQRIQRDYSDARLERVAAYTTTTMRLKPDKWTKMMATDEMRVSYNLAKTASVFQIDQKLV